MRPEHWLYTIPLRLRSLFRWTQAEQELDDELRDHLERATEEYVAKGMTPEAARRRARLDLGGIEQTKEKLPRRAQSQLDSRPDSGFALWSADIAQVAWLHGGGGADASAGDRRKHGYLQRC